MKENADKTLHETFMSRCLQLAENGLGNAAPNPMVGSVIVHNNKIIGEGFHRKCGEAHAEVNAINSVKDKELLKDSTLYVNLEPCSHYGKTPPCSNLIIQHKIPRVVIGCKDTFSLVSGRGIEQLKNAGCAVIVGVMENEARWLNRRFFTFHEKKRPYIVLKWAQTIDGFVDVKRNENEPSKPFWITNDLCKRLVHKWRSEEQAIMVGTNTALKDNPQLNVREWFGNMPLRIVTDRNLRLPKNLNIFDNSQKTLIFNSLKNEISDKIEFVKIDFSENKKNSVLQILEKLYERNILSVFVEGGSELLNTFISNHLWDEARVFTGHKYFYEGTKAPDFPLSETKLLSSNFYDDTFFELRIRQ